MHKTLRHITVLVMAATVLVASTGLSVHHLYCYCKDKMVTSIFRPDEPCEMAEKQSPNKSCCKGTSCNAPVDGEKKHNCADCTSQFVKLDAKYLPSFFDLKHFDIAQPVLPPRFEKVETVTNQARLLRWQQDLPPPPAGKSLLPWIQSFLC